MQLHSQKFHQTLNDATEHCVFYYQYHDKTDYEYIPN